MAAVGLRDAVLISGALAMLASCANSLCFAQKAHPAAAAQSESSAHTPETSVVTSGDTEVADEIIPGPMAVRQLRSLSEEQRRKVISILDSSGVSGVRAQMFQVAKSAGLPPPLPMPNGPGGRGRGASRPGAGQEIGSELLAAMIDANDPDTKTTSAKQTVANKKLRVLRQSLRTKWLAAWVKIKPILTPSQLKELRKNPGGPPRPGFEGPPR